jgi:DNA-binding HxlR family transcriptional regulator
MSDLGALERARPCPIARCLQSIGDHWSNLLVQEAFFGVQDFDTFQRRLGIAPNILSNRLVRLCDHGVLLRTIPEEGGGHPRYRLTDKGLGLYPVAATLRQWAIENMAAPVQHELYHRWCDRPLAVELRCATCGDTTDHASVSGSLAEH